jgi:DNA-binding transcriptional MerR regulator
MAPLQTLEPLQGQAMQIKALAANTGVSVDTLRHYEKEGLLPAPLRRGNNYRDYPPEAVQQVVFIRNCRALDMSLDEVRALLAAARQGGDCAEVEALIDAHLQHVRERLQALRLLERQLKALQASCVGAHAGPACGRVVALSTGPAPRAARGVHSQ